MAKVAMEVKKWLGKDSATIVTRFIGTTPDSSDVRNLMRSICQQICRADEDSESEKVPQVNKLTAKEFVLSVPVHKSKTHYWWIV